MSRWVVGLLALVFTLQTLPVSAKPSLKDSLAAAKAGDRGAQALTDLRLYREALPYAQRAGGGSAAQCGGGYSYNHASGSCSPLVPGLQPYNP